MCRGGFEGTLATLRWAGDTGFRTSPGRFRNWTRVLCPLAQGSEAGLEQQGLAQGARPVGTRDTAGG